MSEYTPGTENIRQTFAYVRAGLDHDDGYPFVMEFHVEAFDRWLAEHDREVKSKAWAEGWLIGVTDNQYDGGLQPTVNPYREESE